MGKAIFACIIMYYLETEVNYNANYTIFGEKCKRVR